MDAILPDDDEIGREEHYRFRTAVDDGLEEEELTEIIDEDELKGRSRTEQPVGADGRRHCG